MRRTFLGMIIAATIGASLAYAEEAPKVPQSITGKWNWTANEQKDGKTICTQTYNFLVGGTAVITSGGEVLTATYKIERAKLPNQHYLSMTVTGTNGRSDCLGQYSDVGGQYGHFVFFQQNGDHLTCHTESILSCYGAATRTKD